MPRLILYLLGTPQVEYDRAPAKVSQRKPLALAAYLAVTGRPHTRERLATLLWPDTDAGRAFAYLRNALWQLNQTPIGNWIEADLDSIALRQDGGIYVDVVAFNDQIAVSQRHEHASADVCRACVAALEAAADLYRGDFMAGFSLEDSAEFDEWQFFQAENLRMAAADVLAQLTHHFSQQPPQALGQALDYGRRWLALDATNEGAHREIMRLYALTDQRAAALRQYDACVRTLRDELGTVPARATVDLYQKIRAGKIAGEARAVVLPDVVIADAAALPDRHPELPTFPTPFVGRWEETAEVLRLLAQANCRLLSVVGPGGIGKTRLALEAARQAHDALGSRYPDGAVFVPLASTTSPEAAVEALTAALRLNQGGQPIQSLGATAIPRSASWSASRVLDYLRDKKMLVVLDNIEHLIQAPAANGSRQDMVAVVETLLDTAPGLTLLVTTRERLNLLSEWVFVLSGMTLPKGDVATLQEHGAIRLFIQSAQRAVVGFEPTAEELTSIARICRLVEGFPLAIELAAAWVRILPCHEIADEILSSYDFLSTSLRDVPLRHRSLRAIFEHSWTLLPAEQREALSRLAVLRGDFTREAGREIADASLATLSALIDRSLLQQLQGASSRGPCRYAMHDVLRQYAEAKLRASDDAYETVRKRHSRYYLGRLQQLWPDLIGKAQKTALDEIDLDLENTRTAWLWAVETKDIAALAQAILPLEHYCNLRGRVREAVELFEKAAEALQQPGESVPTPDYRALVGLLLVLTEVYATPAGNTDRGDLARRGLKWLEPLGSRAETAYANVFAADLSPWATQEETERHLRESLAFFETHGDVHGSANALRRLGAVLAERGDDYAEGEALLERSLGLYRQLGDESGTAQALTLLGLVDDCRGTLIRARQRYQEALTLYLTLDDPRRTIQSLLQIGDLARRIGDPAEAEVAFTDALERAQALGDRLAVARVYVELGILAYEAGDLISAQQYAEDELVLWQQLRLESASASAQQRMGDIALARGDLEDAYRWYAASLKTFADNMWAHLGAGRVADEKGDDALAIDHYRRAVRLVLQSRGLRFQPETPAALKALIGFARVQTRRGDFAEAAETLGTVLTDATLHRHMRAEAESLLAQLREALPADQLEVALAQGRQRSLDAVLESFVS